MQVVHKTNPALTADVAKILGIIEIPDDGGLMLSLDDTRSYYAPGHMVERYKPVVNDYLVTSANGVERLLPQQSVQEDWNLPA